VKKFISGFVAGALLFGGTAAIAAQPGLIGQKVQSVFTIEKDGKKIAEAVAINGSTYAPVRSIAEATGTNLKVEGKTITMSNTNAATSSPDDIVPLSVQIYAKQTQLNDAKGKLSSWQSDKEGWAGMLAEIDPEASTEYGKAIAKKVAEAEVKIAEAKVEVSKIEAELAALQAQQ